MSNLIKLFTIDVKEEKRVLDMNELAEQRFEAAMAKAREKESKKESTGFVEGLNAESIDVDALLSEQDASEVSGNIIKAANEDAKELMEQAHSSAQRIIDEARAEAEGIIAHANEQAKNDYDRIAGEAKNIGYDEGRRQAEKENEIVRGELDRIRKDLHNDYEKKIDELEPMFIETLTGIYEHIFNVDLSSYRDILVYLISRTLHKLDGRSFLVHVNGDDYPYVSMQKKQLLSDAVPPNTDVEIVEDLTVAKNECFIETEAGIFDCGLGTQLSELSNKLRLLSYEKQ